MRESGTFFAPRMCPAAVLARIAHVDDERILAVDELGGLRRR